MIKNDEKNRKDTERKILEAVTGIVMESGFGDLGINAIARKAGVSKVLIYRYFNSRDDLLRRWSVERNYWTTGRHRDFVGPENSIEDIRRLTGEILMNQYDYLKSETIFREILRWQISSIDEVCRDVMEIAEAEGTRTMENFNRHINTNLDTDAVIAVILGGIFYLNLLSDRAPVFNNIPLNTSEGDERIKRGLNQLLDLVFTRIEKKEGPTE